MGKRVAFVLSGSGVRDGTEIHEAVSALIALDGAGFEVLFTAPDTEQAATVDHLTGDPACESRNVLSESARIARGNVVPLSLVSSGDYDALVFPGGFGAATTLCTFASEGAGCSVNREVSSIIGQALADGKPIAAMCIAPVILARTIPGARLTIGSDQGTAAAVRAMGAEHVNCAVDDAVVDVTNRLVTTPAYMLAEGPAEVYAGALRMVEELQTLLNPPGIS